MAGAGTGLALFRAGSVPPRWLGRVGTVLAVALVASGIGYLSANARLAAAAHVSLPLVLVWVTGNGISLGQADRRRGYQALEAV